MESDPHGGPLHGPTSSNGNNDKSLTTCKGATRPARTCPVTTKRGGVVTSNGTIGRSLHGDVHLGTEARARMVDISCSYCSRSKRPHDSTDETRFCDIGNVTTVEGYTRRVGPGDNGNPKMTARHWKSTGIQWKWRRFLFISLLLCWVTCSGVNAVCPTGFTTDIDPDSDIERCIGTTAAETSTLPAARLACRDLGRTASMDADLMKVDTNDAANLASSGFNQEYWVGLTDASIEGTHEWLIDCSGYSAITDAPLSDVTCPASAQDCFCTRIAPMTSNNLMTGNRCLQPGMSSHALCEISQSDDFPEILCPAKYMPIKDRCYRFFMEETAINFNDAEAVCMADGGNLARANQYDCNFAQIVDRAIAASSSAQFLIGLQETGSANQLFWRDNSQPKFVDFTGSTGDCFVLDTSSPNQFMKVQCTAGFTNYICEQDDIEPTTDVMETTVDDVTTPGGDVTTAGGDVTTAVGDLETTAEPGADATTSGAEVTTSDAEATTSDAEATTSEATTSNVEATTSSAGCCPDGSTEIAENCYLVVSTEALTFGNAETACTTLGGVLARVSSEVNDFLVDYFNANPSASSVWIGLVRPSGGQTSLTWVSDNTALIASEANWATGQPSSVTAVNCAYVASSAGFTGQWFLSNCFANFDYLCQFDQNSECVASACDSNPCDNSGPGQIACSTPQQNQVTCTCTTGFVLQTNLGPCLDVNECDSGACDTATQDCTNTVGSFTCACKTGLIVDQSNPTGPCISSCEAVTCDDSGPGSISCENGNCVCATGYQLSGSNGPCINVNECADPAANNCDALTTDCQDTTGSFQCNCKTGFEPLASSTTTCTPIDDPCDPNPCLPGSFNNIVCNTVTGACTCPSGFVLSGGNANGPCVDFNECTAGTDDCNTISTTCVNNDGGFTCSCKTGYAPIAGSTTQCMELNECDLNTHSCSLDTTTCRNTAGSYVCDCLTGYTRATDTTCVDINECTTNTDDCDSVSTTCVNQPPGSHSCTCRPNYIAIAGVTNQCEANECAMGTDDCDTVSTNCVKSAGTFTCQCKTNYVQISGVTNACQDVCAAGQSACDLTSTTCSFSGGVVTCPCRTGFEAIPNSNTACQAATSTERCCPRYSNGDLDNSLYETAAGSCVFFSTSTSGTFSGANTRCADAITTHNTNTGLGLTGGTLAVLTDENIAQEKTGLQTLITDVSGITTFPHRVYVNFQRTGGNFVWGDSSNTVLDAGDPDWATSYPVSTPDDLDCGAVAVISDELGFTNVACDTQATAFCTVDTVTNCPSALTARLLMPVVELGGREAVITQIEDQARKKMLTNALITSVQEAVREPTKVDVLGYSSGSIIAHMEVTVLRPQRIHNYEQLEEAILQLGVTDDEGFITITTSSGDVIVLDSNRLEVDDIENHICHKNTCQNGGTCTFDEQLIEANCQCMEEFEGSRCEAIRGNSTTLIVILAVVMVVMLVVFASCCCCLFVLLRNRAQQKNKMVYQYRPPISQVFAGASQRDGSDQRVVVNRAVAGVDPGYSRRPVNTMPRVVRNRQLDHDAEMASFRNPAMIYDEDETDVESIADQKRLNHFEKIFQNASELNARMSYRGDAASVLSQATSSSPSIYKPPLSDVTETASEMREFNTPYTADGTEN